MGYMKKILAYICTLALLFGMAAYSPAALSAAKAPKISKKTALLTTGKKVTLKIKNAKKNAKVTWKTSNKSVAKVVKKTAKGKRYSAKIKGISAGKAKISAVYKYGGKKKRLICKITVVNAENISQQTTDISVQSENPAVTEAVPTSINEATEPPESTAEPDATALPTEQPADEPTNVSTDEPTNVPTDEPANVPTNEPTKTPTDEPTKAPSMEPTATPSEAPEGSDVKLNLKTAVVLGGVGTASCDDNGTVTANNVDGVLIPIDGEFKAGDVVRVTVKGTASADVRIWISDRSGWTALSNQINPMTFGQTYELTLTGSSSECAVQIKKSGYSSPSIDTLVLNEVLIAGSMIEPTPVPKPTDTPKPTSTPQPGEESYSWVTTWGTAEEKCDITAEAMPQMTLNGSTVRQIVRVTTGGNRLKLRLSNQYGGSDVNIVSLHLAKQVQADASTIDVSTDTVVTVGGQESFVIPKGKVIETDPVNFSVNALDNVAVSAYFGQTPTNNITGHRGARATTYQVSGNKVSERTLTSYKTTTSWFFLADISMWSPQGSKAVVCFGDSITDGYGTDASYLGRKPDSYTRWVDYFAKRLQANEGTKHISVINEGIGSNSILGSYPTDAGKDRFQRDLLEHDGVGYCIILFGVNDLNKLQNTSKYDQLLPEYQKMVQLCHDNGIKVYGAPILPFGTSSYYSEASEQVRTMINEWMRSSDSQMDGIIDFESAVADPANPKNILEEYTHSDGLHPYDGYEAMANAIDLTMFE